MSSKTTASLRSLEGSEDLAALESRLVLERTDVLSDLHTLEESPELLALSRSLAFHPSSTILEILEEFERLDRNDEHLHSRFLEFLLNPHEERNGLSDRFLKELLRKTRFFLCGTPGEQPDYDADFGDTEITREAVSEQGRADFKLTNRRQKLVLLIENKILSSEGERQLERYWEDAEREHPSFAIGGLFLTPNGRPPRTAGKYSYGAISYSEIAELLDACVESRHSDSSLMFAKQYSLAIRRWFVEDPERNKLAWRIFNKFPDAAAYLSRDDAKPLWQVCEHLLGLVRNVGSNVTFVNGSPKTKELEFWFVPREWDKIQKLRHAGTAEQEKQADDRLLMFWFYCWPQSEHENERELSLYLGAVPGAHANDVRNVTRAVTAKAPPSSPGIEIHDEPQLKWTYLWARRFLTEEQLGQLDRDVVFKLIDEGWQQFLEVDLPKLTSVISTLFQKPQSQRSA